MIMEENPDNLVIQEIGCAKKRMVMISYMIYCKPREVVG